MALPIGPDGTCRYAARPFPGDRSARIVAGMAVHAPAFPRADMWHGRYGSALALLAVVLPFALVLVWAVAQQAPSPAGLTDELRATATVVDDHAAAMARVADHLTAAVGASTAADRAVWAAYGERMSTDARSLQGLAAQLRSTATALDPLRQSTSLVGGTTSGALAAYADRWSALRTDALAVSAHGRAMQQAAGDLQAAVALGLMSSDDAAAIATATSGMIAAGDRIGRMCDMQLASIDQMQRGMGIAR